MTLSPAEFAEFDAKTLAYELGESNNLDGIEGPVRERLIAKRAELEEARRAFDAAEAKKAADAEQLAKAGYISAGNSESDWKRDRERVLSDQAMARVDQYQRRGGTLISKSEALA